MKREERQVNLNNAFEFNSKLNLENKDVRIILVDDVMTTGTTLEQCAQTLILNGYKNINALVFAHG
jgi:predicted amidophosphoribosyltransferase